MEENKTFLSTDGETHIHVHIWYPDENTYEKPLGIVQISHGMVDYIERYAPLAKYMTACGFLVVGNDHLGHGQSVTSKEKWGYFCEKNTSATVVHDLFRLTRMMKKKYEDLPYFLLGHSMGSFLARRYAMEHGEELTGLLLLGTGNQLPVVVAAGMALANFVGKVKGEGYRSTLVKTVMFGRYNQRIKERKSPNDWISSDRAVVAAYDLDEKCSFTFTINGNKGLLSTLQFIQKRRNIAKLPRKLPILMAAGLEDPVGNYGKAVKKLYEQYTGYVEDAELRLYEDCRHELHNERNRQEIFEDLCGWLRRHL